MVKRFGKYDIYGTLGSGSFGKVKYAVNNDTCEEVAIKVLKKETIKSRKMGPQIKREITIMKMIDHPYVVSVNEVFATNAKLYIVMEYVGGGELFDKIVEAGKFNEETAKFYFRQLIEGVEHCHIHGVCHRDLKPENILLDKEGNIKISDFGFSTIIKCDENGNDTLHSTCGTPNYVAPEIIKKVGYDGRLTDIWSMGVILYALLAGFLPFDEPDSELLFEKIKIADFEFPDWFSIHSKDLINRILVTDPKNRASLNEIKNHYWIKRKDIKDLLILDI